MNLSGHDRDREDEKKQRLGRPWLWTTIDGRYQVTEILGAGAFGVVVKANRISDDEVFAVKILNKSEIRCDKDVKHVTTEVRLLQSLRHPFIVGIEEVLASSSYIFLVMEYLAGGNLASCALSFDTTDMTDIRRVFQQLVDAISFMHEEGCYHRDIKLSNIMFNAERHTIKLIDFGLAALRDDNGSHICDSEVGTPGYAAPEIFREREYDASSVDVWSMGVCLYVLVKKKLPFADMSIKDFYSVLEQTRHNIDLHGLSLPLRDLIMGMLTWDPRERYTLQDIKASEWLGEYTRVNGEIETNVPAPTIIADLNAFDIFGKVSTLDLERMLVPNEQDLGMTKTFEVRNDALDHIIHRFFVEKEYGVEYESDRYGFAVLRPDDEGVAERIYSYSILRMEKMVDGVPEMVALLSLSQIEPNPDEFADLVEELDSILHPLDA